MTQVQDQFPKRISHHQADISLYKILNLYTWKNLIFRKRDWKILLWILWLDQLLTFSRKNSNTLKMLMKEKRTIENLIIKEELPWFLTKGSHILLQSISMEHLIHSEKHMELKKTSLWNQTGHMVHQSLVLSELVTYLREATIEQSEKMLHISKILLKIQ